MRHRMVKILLLVSFLLASCQKKTIEHEPLQHIRINIVDEIQSLDPRKARDLNSIAFMKMIYEGLTRFSKEGKIELALVKSMNISEDRKTYTFVLKDTIWMDGTKVTSYDFAKSWKKVLDPAFPSIMSYRLFIIEGAKEVKEGIKSVEDLGIYTPDPVTLIVKLAHPVPYFLELLSMPVFFPISENLERSGSKWEEKEELYLGNGPFKLKKWEHQNSIELVKNEKYWDRAAVKLDKLSLYMISAETEINMFETKKIDWAGSPFSTLPIDAIKNLSKLKTFVRQPFLGTSFIRVNMDWCKAGFSSEKDALLFRRFLAYSVERDTIAKHVLHDSEAAAGGFLPPSLRDANFFGDYDDMELYSEFSKIGFVGPIKLSFVNNDRNYLVMQALQRQWEEKLHIKLELEPLELKAYFQKLFSGKYQLALGCWHADFNDSINFLEIFKYKNSGMNNTFWENAEYIDLLNRADICIDIEERYKLLQQAHIILMDEMPIIPIFHLYMCYLKNEKIKDVVILPVGRVDYRWAYIGE